MIASVPPIFQLPVRPRLLAYPSCGPIEHRSTLMDCYIALGTNLGNLGANLRAGLEGLGGLAQGPMA